MQMVSTHSLLILYSEIEDYLTKTSKGFMPQNRRIKWIVLENQSKTKMVV